MKLTLHVVLVTEKTVMYHCDEDEATATIVVPRTHPIPPLICVTYGADEALQSPADAYDEYIAKVEAWRDE